MPGESTPNEDQQRRRAFRPFLIAAIVLVVLFLIAAVGGGIYTSVQYRQLVDLGKNAQAEYRDLREAHPFEPAEATAVDDARWSDLVEVRATAMRALTPYARAQLAKLLELESLQEIDPAYMLKLLPLGDQLKAVVDAHVGALEAHAMSGEEYRWLLGHAVRDSLAAARGSEAATAAPHWRVLQVVERLSLTDGKPETDTTAEAVYERIDQEFEAGRASAQSAAALGEGDAVEAMLDLITVAAPWAEADSLTNKR